MPTIHWSEGDAAHSAPWHSETAAAAPRRVAVVDDSVRADAAYRMARAGDALLWRGTFPGARHLLTAMGRRVDAPARTSDPAEAFRRHRRERRRRAEVLGRLVIRLDADHSVRLRRAPDVRAACTQAYGPPQGPMVVALQELLGVIGAHQWRERGVPVPALDARVHPHYGVFAPTAGDYVDLVARAPLPASARTAFDLGTGTGVLAAVLARRGLTRVVATDANPRALACARDNAARLNLTAHIQVTGPRLFPDTRADLIVCNPPWIPATPTSPFEEAVYDRDGAMLNAVLAGLPAHLNPAAEAWLILSDLPERLGLRTRTALHAAITQAGLHVIARLDTHPRRTATAPNDPLNAARAAEIVSLWRLRAADSGPAGQMRR